MSAPQVSCGYFSETLRFDRSFEDAQTSLSRSLACEGKPKPGLAAICGRIAAALNDMLDAPDDDNRGSSFAGREGYGDNNAQARISLASMFRDTLWGRPAHDDVLSFWNALSNAITPQQRELGYEILYFNYMPVPEPDACVAAQVSQASLPDARPTLAGLRAFRDRVLESATGGQQLIDS